MYKILKWKFFYVYVWTDDIITKNIFEAYCEGRSRLWNYFFGFRMSTEDNQYYFWIPANKYDFLTYLALNAKRHYKQGE